MKRYTKSALALLLAFILLISSSLPIFAANEPTTYSKNSNSGTRDVVCTTLNGTSALSYYTGSYTYDNLDDLSATALESALRTLMRSTHSYTSSYDDCHYKAHLTDCENNNTNYLSLIYTGYDATQNQWNGWNREHVWPKSLGADNTKGGGADLHHIRPSDAVVNSTRGNKKYGYSNGGKQAYGSNPASGYLGGSYGTYYEPLDNVKGDVARICLYVYVRWYDQWEATSITKVFQSVDVLLEWCEMDPVDTWEMGRNEVVQKIQGNRNVFIDYPELAWLIFDREVPDDMVTPSGEAMKGNTGGDVGGNTGGDVGGNTGGSTDTSCTHATTVTKYQSDATCGKDGYTGNLCCATCGAVISEGSVINATGNHTWGQPEVVTPPTSDTDGTQRQFCDVCGQSKISSIPATPDVPDTPDDLQALLEDIENEDEKVLILIYLGAFDSLLYDLIS